MSLKEEDKPYLIFSGMVVVVFIIFLSYTIISVQSTPLFICNNILKGDDEQEVYPPFQRFLDDLLIQVGADFSIVSSAIETRSDKKVFEETGGIVFCGVPVELCFAKKEFYLPSYCLLYKIDLPIASKDWEVWYNDK